MKALKASRMVTSACVIALTSITMALPSATAVPCIDENEWFCEPDPQATLEPELGACVQSCSTATYRGPGPGDDVSAPEVWLFQCRENIGGFIVPVPLVGTEPACPAGWEMGDAVPPTPLIPSEGLASTDGTDLITIVTGQCAVTWEATAYGSGLERHTRYVPCAHPA